MPDRRVTPLCRPVMRDPDTRLNECADAKRFRMALPFLCVHPQRCVGRTLLEQCGSAVRVLRAASMFGVRNMRVRRSTSASPLILHTLSSWAASL